MSSRYILLRSSLSFGSGRCCSVGGFPGCLVSFQRLGKNKRLQEKEKTYAKYAINEFNQPINQPNASSI